MDRLVPTFLNRDQLRSFLGNRPDLIRAFEDYIRALSTDIPDELAELQLIVSTVMALSAALSQSAEEDRQATEAARMAILTGQFEQLREQVAAMPSPDTALNNLQVQLQQLREEIPTMKPKRVERRSLTFVGAGSTLVVSPSLSSLAELRYLGAYTNGATFAEAAVAVSLSGSTITATRGGAGAAVTVNVEITDW